MSLRSFFAALLIAGLWIGARSSVAQTTAEAPTTDEVRAFVQLATIGDLQAIEAKLAGGMDINAATPSGVTVLHAAQMSGFRDLAEILIEKGADASIPLPEPAKLADRTLAHNTKDDSAAIAVLVTQDGQQLFQKCVGKSDRKAETPAEPETMFRIGSVTKQFTAAAILKLQEAGKLSVDDKLAKYFPDFPRGDEVTLHHLLSHTSGIQSYTSKPAFALRVLQPIEVPALIEEIQDYPFDFNPGEKWMYSNSGYMLLGRIVELAAGQSYGEFLQETFFQPLGMTRTGVYDHDVEYSKEAQGYSYVDDKFITAKPWHMSWAGGAGAIYSTVGDLVRWNEAVFGGKVLSEASMHLAFAPAKLNDGEATSYGYGWGISENRGLKQISHSGGLDGFQSYLSRIPEHNVTIVALTNSSPAGPGLSASAAGNMLQDLFLWQQMAARSMKTVDDQVDVAQLDEYLGRYDYGSAIMTVTREGDQLYGRLTGQPRIEIFPKSPTEFFAKIVDAEIEFVLDDQDKVTHVMHRQGGREIKAPRTGDAPLAAELSEQDLESFVGVYDYGPLGKLTVKRQGKQLFAQLTGQPSLPVQPVSLNELSWLDVNAQLKCERGEDGQITNAVHHQGGQEIRVNKIE